MATGKLAGPQTRCGQQLQARLQAARARRPPSRIGPEVKRASLGDHFGAAKLAQKVGHLRPAQLGPPFATFWGAFSFAISAELS